MPKLNQLRKQDHMHLWDLPNSVFPRNSKAKKYQQELMRTVTMMSYTNERLQHAALVCNYEIGAITTSNKPGMIASELFRLIKDFAYHYENYCARVYSCRDKFLQFVNAILPIGYSDHEVKIRHIVINPVAKAAHVVVDLEKFNKSKSLHSVIHDRHDLTHRLFYGQQFDHYFRPIVANLPQTKEERRRYYREWRKIILQKAKVSNDATLQIMHLANSISTKIFKYKDHHRKNKD